MNKEPTNEDGIEVVCIVYKNYRGETGIRHVIPKAIRFASTDWHPEPQWLLEAYDVDKKADRSFAMKDIQEWKVVEG